MNLKRVLMVFAVIVFISVYTNAAVYLNKVCPVHENCENGEAASAKSISLNILFVEMAGKFLESFDHYLIYVHSVEMSEIKTVDLNSQNENLWKAIEKLNYSIDYMQMIIDRVTGVPNNPFIEAKLKDFDYADFALNQGLFTEVFSKVKFYLVEGNLIGAYNEALYGQVVLRDNLMSQACNNEVPRSISLKSLRGNLHKYMEIQLFGQYITEVFEAL